jgi:hypothetical protein
MNNITNPKRMKIAYICIISEKYGYRWLVTEEITQNIIAKSQVVYHEKIDAFLAGADLATALGYAPRQP